MSSINEKLSLIQQKLKVPKSQYNNFGKYHYRNAEDILESVKKLLIGCHLTLTDEIHLIGNRYYVRSKARLMDDNGEWIEVSAFAREPEDKKGMDVSQITGSTSSYARKYALNGLFAIDDTKDSDSDDMMAEKDSKSHSIVQNSKPLPDYLDKAGKMRAVLELYSVWTEALRMAGLPVDDSYLSITDAKIQSTLLEKGRKLYKAEREKRISMIRELSKADKDKTSYVKDALGGKKLDEQNDSWLVDISDFLKKN